MINVEEQMSKPTGDGEETLKPDDQSASKLDQEGTDENSVEQEESELDAATGSSDLDQLQRGYQQLNLLRRRPGMTS